MTKRPDWAAPGAVIPAIIPADELDDFVAWIMEGLGEHGDFLADRVETLERLKNSRPSPWPLGKPVIVLPDPK